ncbi:MAG: methionyl-tRNA formyltransferase [Bacillota bacterium]
MNSFRKPALVFMGTPDFAVPALRALVESEFRVLRVVTQPDRPRGRGNKLAPGPVKAYALKQGLEILQPVNIRDHVFVDLIRELRPDFIVVAAFGRILPGVVLDIPRLGCVNVHASLLPRYRGAAPIHWAVMNGEPETGVTTMLMDEGLDTGDILLQEKTAIGPDDNFGVVHDRLAELGAVLLVRTLDRLTAGELVPRPQNESRATYAPPLRREHEVIDWTRTAEEIKNQVRGLDPWPGAHTMLNGRVLKVWRAEIAGDRGGGRPGQVLLADPVHGLVVSTGAGAVRLLEVQPAGRRRVRAEDFLRGYPVPVDTVLGRAESGSTD